MKNLIFLIALFFFLTHIYSQTNYWQGDVSTNWHNAYNWSLNHVPNNTEDATIPGTGVLYFPNVYSGNAECKNLTVVSGANVEMLNGISFHIYGDANISGSIIFTDELIFVYLHDDIFWWDGSQCINNSSSPYGSTFYIYDDWNFETGSNVVMDKVEVSFVPDGTSSSIITCNSSTSSFYSIGMLKASGSTVLLSGSSTETMQVTNKLTIATDNNFYSYSNHDIIVYKHFDNEGHFYFSTGNLIIDDCDFDFHFNEGDFANNLNITTNNSYVDIGGDVIINGDIEINGAGVDIWNTLFLGGDYDNNASGTDIDSVIINGGDIQNIYNLECNALILDKPSGEMRFPSETSSCNHYDWVQGMYRVNGATFTINDLVDNGIFGTISVTSGELNIHQDAGQFVDLNATLFISSGVCNILGGGYESFWSYADDASITMSGGTLDFVDNGIRVYNTASHTFSENITGGTIRTPYHFKIYRDNFTPTGGLIQLYGTPDVNIIQVAGSNFYDLEINKSSKNYNTNPIIHKSRDGEEMKFGKSNGVIATTDLDINGDFTLSAGSFSAPPVMTVAGNWTNTVGVSAFFEEFGLVVFDGSVSKYCHGEEFYNLEINKPGALLIFPDGPYTSCESYDWTQGGYQVDGAMVYFHDLVDDGIYGNIILSSGFLYLSQGTSSGEYVDLNGSLTIIDGSMSIHGGIDDSYWTYNGDVSFNMSGGNLTFWDVGIRIFDSPSYTFSENITGGSIRIRSNFIVERNNFTPENNLLFMTGSMPGVLSHVPGSNLHDLTIAKTAEDKNGDIYEKHPRIKIPLDDTKSTTITALSDLDINGDFKIFTEGYDGNFIAPAVMKVAGNWNNLAGEDAFVEGTGLVIFDGADDADILNTETFYNLTEDKTSASPEALEIIEPEAITILNDLEISDGVFYMNNNTTLDIDNDLTIEDGARLKANNGIINIGGDWDDNNTGDVGFYADYSTVTFDGPDHQYLYCDYLYAEFNNLIIDKPGSTGMDSFEPLTNVRMFGSLQVMDGNWYDTPSDNNHKLFGDLFIGPDGRWTDISGFVTLSESATQSFVNNGGGYFDNIAIAKGNQTDHVNLGGNLVFNHLLILAGDVEMANNYYLCHDGITVQTNSGLSVEAGAWIVSDAGAQIFIEDEGTLALNGTETDHIVMTRNGSSGYYSFDVVGHIGAEFADFSFMSDYGIEIHGTVDNDHAFNNCSFSNGETGGNYLFINNSQILHSEGVTFNTNNWGGSSNVKKDWDSGQITFTNFTGDFAGEAYDDDVFDRIHWDEGIRELDVSVFLEGPYSGGLMETTLNSQNLIPNEQPYNVSPWNYSGSESVPNMPNTDVVDWVMIEYRDAPNAASATAATTIGRQAAFLLNNGNIVDLDGSSFPNFPYILNDQLFVVIWHRNHLGVMSAAALSESGGVYNYNFTSGAGQAYNSGQKNLGGIYGMYAGDANADDIVNNIDKNNYWDIQTGLQGYLATDFSMDGQVNNIDKNDMWNLNQNTESQIP